MTSVPIGGEHYYKNVSPRLLLLLLILAWLALCFLLLLSRTPPLLPCHSPPGDSLHQDAIALSYLTGWIELEEEDGILCAHQIWVVLPPLALACPSLAVQSCTVV